MPTFQGAEFEVKGDKIKVGDTLRLSSRLVGKDLSNIDVPAYKGKKLIVNVFPSRK